MAGLTEFRHAAVVTDKESAAGTAEAMNAGTEKAKPKVKTAAEKVGRNDPCPCGSGKKYKQCCGRKPV